MFLRTTWGVDSGISTIRARTQSAKSRFLVKVVAKCPIDLIVSFLLVSLSAFPKIEMFEMRFLTTKLALIAGLIFSLSAQADRLIFVSIDGMRWDYMDKYDAPNLNAMAEGGVRVRQLAPVYPSKTFPGHLSLITGLSPLEHGIADNHFCDRDRNDCYHMGDGGKDSTWLKGVPLWNLVEAYGFKAATYFWPESDARIGGMTPSYHFHYSKHAEYQGRVDQLIAWLEMPEASRPKLLTLYFSKVDSMGHEHGPDAPETAAAVAEVDALIGQLMSAVLAANASNEGEKTNLVVVSDHGMAETRGESALALNQWAPEIPGFRRMNGYTRVAYYPESEAASTDLSGWEKRLTANSQGRYKVIGREALRLPKYTGPVREVDVSRLPWLVLETSPPAFFTGKSIAPDKVEGSHGYHVGEVEDMNATLVGIGPAFKTGFTIEEASQLDVYPVAAKILGLQPLNGLPSDGGELKALLSD